MKVPEVWNEEMVDTVKELGFSQFGLNMLQPSPGHWTVDLLMKHLDTHGPTMLDPYLTGKQGDYAKCRIHNIPGFNIPTSVQNRRKINTAKTVKRHDREDAMSS